MWYKASGTTLYQELNNLRSQIASTAQAVYEEWDADSEEDEELDGALEIIAENITEIIAENITDVHLSSSESEPVIAYSNNEAYAISIPNRTANNKSWFSSAELQASDIDIIPVNIDDIDYHED